MEEVTKYSWSHLSSLTVGAPVDRLPTELLVEIFSNTQMNWRAPAPGSPKLWRLVWATSSLNYIRTSLVRSKNTTITFALGDPDIFRPALRLVWPHLHHVRHLELPISRRCTVSEGTLDNNDACAEDI
ncbi:hypothetical protein BV20DRAFT_704698 [Pilatotrama ljubarskyi]|nr:hypothetical protein BV20DRAFT_704698 [Pilatotrama ljubarskyi]